MFESTPLIIDHGPVCDSGWAQLHDFDQDGDPDLVVLAQRNDLAGGPTQLTIRRNRAITGPGTVGAAGPTQFNHSTPHRGNSTFTLSLSGALAGAPAWLGISTGMAFAGTAPNGIWLDLTPGALLSPTAAGGGSYMTNSAGGIDLVVPIPAGFPTGAGFFAQWAVSDPSGAFGLVPGYSLTLSPARHVFVW